DDTLSFPSLKKIGGSLHIYHFNTPAIGIFNVDSIAVIELTCPDISTLSSFNNLIYCNHIGIYFNSNLITIDDFKSLPNVNTISISNNQNLKNIYGFNQLNSAASFGIGRTDSLESVFGFNNLKYVTTNFLLIENKV